MTYKTSTVKQVDELLRFLYDAIDARVDLRHSDRPYSTWHPPGVPVPGCQLAVCQGFNLLT